jgi:hypothetical protein
VIGVVSRRTGGALVRGRHALARGPLRRGELNVARAMERQQQAATDRIARQAVRLPPLPGLAQLQRHGPATDPRRGQEHADRRQIARRHDAAAIRERDLQVPSA